MATIIQQLILGLVQGIVEWIPFSSEGVLLLVQSNFYSHIELNLFLRQALLLHLGTFFAALIYFRKDVINLIKGLFNYKKTDPETKKLLNFLIITTIISGIIGLAILKFIDLSSSIHIPLTRKTITITIGFFLILTGYLQLKSRASYAGSRTIYNFNYVDSVFLGVMQGIAAIPGLSRSGLTVSSLLFRNIDDMTALRVSFLMSLPIVLIANILLNFRDLTLIKETYIGVIIAFFIGLLTIHLLMKIAEKVRFGWFVIFIAVMMILSAFI